LSNTIYEKSFFEEKKKYLPNILKKDNISLVRVLPKDNKRLSELLDVYKRNKKHLTSWHHNWNKLLFKNIDEYKKYHKEEKMLCYALYFDDKIIGTVEIGRLTNYDKNMKCRKISYWIDKNYTRMGIMYNSLIMLEKALNNENMVLLIAEVETDNEPSINLMKKLNYSLKSISWLVAKNGKTAMHYMEFNKLFRKKR
jgi:RimJ/RimL family protein N-acetyltransferase